MKHLKFRLDQSFVIVVGIAALIHSTWSIATFSGGEAPVIAGIPENIASWLWWVLPGFLAAFALEVGQVETARQIKRGQGRKFKIFSLTVNMKVVTFIVLSAGTYLFQLVYLLHHFPNLPMSAGLSETSKAAAKTVMEIVVWLSPLLLPLTMWMAVASDAPESVSGNLAAAKPERISIDEVAIWESYPSTKDYIEANPFLSIPNPVKSSNGNGSSE